MNLRDYLHKENLTAKDFALRCGYSPVYIREIAQGRPAGPKLANIICMLTHGEVAIEEVMPPIKVEICPHCQRVMPKKREVHHD